jgi:hypothetical protein
MAGDFKGGVPQYERAPVDPWAEKIAEAVARRLNPQEDRALYSPKTLAVRLNVSERTARQKMLDGDVESFKLGEGDKAPIRATAEAVDAYLARMQGGTS